MTGTEFTDLPRAVREFRPGCPGCTPDVVTADESRPCSHYDCPGLPPELQVTCNTCMYDFVAGDGQLKCDHATCETAQRLKANVDTYNRWVAMLRAEASGSV